MTSPNKYFLKAQIHSLEAFMGDIKQKSTFLFFWFINIFLIGVGKRKTDTDWASINFMHNCKIHQLLEEVFPCLLLLSYYCEYTWCLWCFIVVINLLSGWHQVTFIYPITHWILCGCQCSLALCPLMRWRLVVLFVVVVFFRVCFNGCLYTFLVGK